MKILVINAGSSSLKYQLINMENEHVIAKGNCERIGIAGGRIAYKTDSGVDAKEECDFPSHTEAFLKLIEILTSGEGKVIDSVAEISAVGHRVLHGSEVYKQSTLITGKVIDDIESFSDLGPLHNPPQAAAMRACRKVLGPDVPMVAVFDTSFHQTMPEKAYMYGIPYEYYEKYHIRKYGFHGTSHRYVSSHFLQITGKDPVGTKLVVCHLGNGSSITAVKDGKCVDTTMGFTPLAGLPMGTRSGDLDAGILEYIMGKYGYDIKEMVSILNKKSGVQGVSGVSSDFRDLENAHKEGNERAGLAVDMFNYGVKKYIGAYAAAMGGVDAIIFTAGVGENSASQRLAIASDLEFMGVKMDAEANSVRGKETVISAADSKVKVLLIPTNEELMIAMDTAAIAKG